MKVKNKGKTPTGTKVSKEFEFPLSDADYNRMGREVGKIRKGLTALDLQAKEVIENWKTKLAAAKDKLTALEDVMGAEKQKRMVEATLVKDFESKEIQYWFEGRIIERRTMTEAECQMEIEPKTRKRAKEQKIEKDQGTIKEQIERRNTAEVIKMETKKGTKHSAVDGPTAS